MCSTDTDKQREETLTLNNTESKQVTVLQPQEVTHLDQQFLAQGLHLRTREDHLFTFI